MSSNAARAKPRTRGSKPACTLRPPEALNVANVRPWNALSMTNTVGSLMPILWPWRRAILMAASLASAPELPKNTLLMPEAAQSLSASASWFGMVKKFEQCVSTVACSATALDTAG